MSDNVQPGKYRAKAISGDLGVKGERAFLYVDFQLTESGENVRWFGHPEGKGDSLGICVRALRACGWTGSDITDLSGLGDNEVELDIVIDSYKGDGSSKVNWVNAIGGAPRRSKEPSDPIDAKKKMAIAKRIAAQVEKMENLDDLPF
jgi:hypothetical protein